MLTPGSPVWFGGDYNPEQWPEDVWQDDYRLMRQAGVTVATVGVFAWARIEPRDGEFDFGWLDRVIDGLHAAGVAVDLATATASPPAWLARKHPEMLPVTADGVVLGTGSRQNYNPSSAAYREHATRLVRALAERYGSHPAVVAWHINNEYGCHVPKDYGDETAAAFRLWLERKYSHVYALNAAWGTAFWSQHYDSFAEIDPPRATPTFRNPTQVLDFDRFGSAALLECFRAEAAILREVTPNIPITTNFMGFFKPADYWEWAREVDVVSDDSYPDPADPGSSAHAAMTRDLMRSLRGGQSWLLMEQAAGAVNWRSSNAPRLPGENRLYSMQAVARGADAVLYFQWRQSAAGAEKFHSGMVPHAGEDSRVFREVRALGAELGTLGDIVGSRITANAAIVLDWDAWWAIEQDALPTHLDYVQELAVWHSALRSLGVTTQFVRAEDDLDGYGLVIVPALQVATTAALENLAAVPARGGSLVVGYQTGILDENLHVHADGYLGALSEVLGVRVEEFAPLAAPDQRGLGNPNVPATTILVDGVARSASIWTELVHTVDADVVATFTEGLAAGAPAITRRDADGGAAWYVATRPENAVVLQLLRDALAHAGLAPTLDGSDPLIETVERGGHRWVFNFGGVDREVQVGEKRVRVPARDVVRMPSA